MDQKIKAINKELKLYFEQNPHAGKIPAKDLMPLFIKAGIFNKDHRNGLPIRDLLRKLDKAEQLRLIPYVLAERKGVNTNWYFAKAKGVKVVGVKAKEPRVKQNNSSSKKQTLEHVQIKFNTSWFQTAYYVYVITVIKANKPVFYYVGQTGDRKHITARSPFYRLTSHFRPYNGTDSQLANEIFKSGLLQELNYENNGYGLEQAFHKKELEIKADYFKLLDFDGNNHSINRQFSEEVEQLIIRQIPEDKLVNKITKKKIENSEAEIMAKQIIKKLKIK